MDYKIQNKCRISVKAVRPETDAEKHRLEYLERRLELDERILKAEQAQLFEEKTGNKFTDLFDKDHLNTQYLAGRNIKNKE